MFVCICMGAPLREKGGRRFRELEVRAQLTEISPL